MVPSLPIVYVPRSELYNKLNEDCKKFKILYFSANIGFGKTTAIIGWITESKFSFDYIKAENQTEILDTLKSLNLSDKNELHLIIIDDFHKITSPEIRNEIVNYISITSMYCHFILIGRTLITAEFKPYALTRQLNLYEAEDFKFTYDECVTFFENNEVMLSMQELDLIYKTSNGYPIALNAVVGHIKNNSGKSLEEIIKLSASDIYDYFDVSLFGKWPAEIQNFLIRIANLNEITPMLAQMVTLRADSRELLEYCHSLGRFVTHLPPDTYIINSFFKEYLLNKQEKLLDKNEIKRINSYTGSYYEMLGDHAVEALKYYCDAGNTEKIKFLLTEDASHGVAAGNFIELEPYYMSLSEEDILQSPMLCSAVSMLHSINCRSKESKYYLNKLLEMRNNIKKNTEDYHILEEQIAYLTIALPHSGTKGFISKFMRIAKQFAVNGFHMQEIAVTGNMPSLMHGGKDFCKWSKMAQPLRKMLKAPMEFVFQTYGMGLVDTGVGEAYYEQDKLDAALVELTKGTTDSRNKGSTEMLFAGTAVLSKLLAAKGEYESAVHMMEGIKERIIIKGKKNLMPNLEAFIVCLQLLIGEMENAEKWFINESPDENLHFYITERYRYLIKIKMYIIHCNYLQAEILLERLKKYFMEYSRNYDYMEAALLESIIYYRKEDERWKENLEEVLIMAQRFSFIRIFADEGSVVYPMLLKMKKNGNLKVNPVYFEKIINAVHKQAVLYPNYLKSDTHKNTSLTNTELIVLTFLSQGKKYRDIEKIMGISSNTVKFHVKHIYQKLSANSRNEAIANAKKLKIV